MIPNIYGADSSIPGYFLVVVIFIIIILVLFSINDNSSNEEIIIDSISMDNMLDQTTIEAGQIWLSETDNPFNEDIYWYIIETKKGYVRFTGVKYNKDKNLWVIPKQIQYGISNKISMFKRAYVRVK